MSLSWGRPCTGSGRRDGQTDVWLRLYCVAMGRIALRALALGLWLTGGGTCAPAPADRSGTAAASDGELARFPLEDIDRCLERANRAPGSARTTQLLLTLDPSGAVA